MAGAVEVAPLIIAGEARRTHADIDVRARQAATGFLARGIGAGARVALLLHNASVVFEAQRAAALAGAMAVPLDKDLAAEDLLFILDDCQARLLVVHDDLLAPIRPRLPDSLTVMVAVAPAYARADERTRMSIGDDIVWDAWLAGHAPFAGSPPAGTPSLSYTSGSSGRPKPVLRSPAPRTDRPSKATRVYGFDDPGHAVVLVTGPLSHSVPRAFARLAVEAGADLVLMARFDAEHALALIARHGITHVHLSPAMMSRMLRAGTRERHATASLRHVVHGAAPCPPSLKAAAIAAWGPIVHEYYGSTETGLLTMADSADAAERPGTVGRALPSIALAVLDVEGRSLPPGAVGRIYAGSATMGGFTYPGRPAERDAIALGDLVTAGDLGHLDDDGYLFLRDRGRDIVRIGTDQVVPADLEAALLSVAGVADCAVLGLETEGGTIVCACIELLHGVTAPEAEIAAVLACATPVPVRVEFLDHLPRADTGKMFKHRLRRMLGETTP